MPRTVEDRRQYEADTFLRDAEPTIDEDERVYDEGGIFLKLPPSVDRPGPAFSACAWTG